MQDTQPQEKPSPSEVYGHLISIEDDLLILPKSAVIEVVGLEAVNVQTAGPAWLLGTANWRGKRLPVISLEAMAGASVPARSRRSRAVVINGFGMSLDSGLFMLLAQGYPHLTALNAAALVPQARLPRDEGIALCRVRLARAQAMIPDLESIEMQVASAMDQVGDDELAGEDWQPGNSA